MAHEYVGDVVLHPTEFCSVTWNPEFLELPLTAKDRAEAAAREPGPELEHALSSLEDRWEHFKGQHNLLVGNTHHRLERRSTMAAQAFWCARRDLLGRNFAHRSVFESFRILSRLHLARFLTLRLGCRSQPDMRRARLTRAVQGTLVKPKELELVVYPAGTEVLVLETSGPCHWFVEFSHSNDSFEGGFEYETIEVANEALEFHA